MHKVKVAIFTDVRGSGTPAFLKEEVEKSDKYWRVALAKVLEELPYTVSEEDGGVLGLEYITKLREGKIDYLKIHSNNGGLEDLYYFMSDKSGYPYKVEIAEVDTAYPWQIKHYNGAEFIESLSNTEVIDKSINLCRW